MSDTEEGIRSLNAHRKYLGLPPIVETKRSCLSCDKEFKSLGPQIRMCRVCRQKKEIFKNG